ncbi:hypothetical protein [Polymorphospora sp. NPDC050346]|uniref:hypothetical protein n=1 Tax=Polymorphospora sp. NPDC050346 TaxID=3155780 RepID=UPI0033F613BD
MADHATTLAEQIRTEVGRVVAALDGLLGPAAPPTAAKLPACAAAWAAQLDTDGYYAERVARHLVDVLWPTVDPPTEWWRTPLGRAVARTIGHPRAEVVSYAVAGAMTGVSKQYIGKLVAAGRLSPGPAGGVTTASVHALAKTASE